MYIEVTGQKAGNKAVLNTPMFRKSSRDCKFQFWYNMQGNDIGTLEVNLTSTFNGTNTTQLTKLDKRTSKTWEKSVVDVGMQEQFYISLVGEVGQNFRGDIAIDDLLFVDCRVGMSPILRVLYCYITT